MSESLTFEATIAQARTLLSIGATSEQLVEWGVREFPGEDRPDMEAVEAEARRRMQDDAGEGVSWASACRLQRLSDLYSRSLHTQDYKGCLAIEKELVVAKGERDREAKAAARAGAGSDRRPR